MPSCRSRRTRRWCRWPRRRPSTRTPGRTGWSRAPAWSRSSRPRSRCHREIRACRSRRTRRWCRWPRRRPSTRRSGRTGWWPGAAWSRSSRPRSRCHRGGRACRSRRTRRWCRWPRRRPSARRSGRTGGPPGPACVQVEPSQVQVSPNRPCLAVCRRTRRWCRWPRRRPSTLAPGRARWSRAPASSRSSRPRSRCHPEGAQAAEQDDGAGGRVVGHRRPVPGGRAGRGRLLSPGRGRGRTRQRSRRDRGSNTTGGQHSGHDREPPPPARPAHPLYDHSHHRLPVGLSPL